MQFGGRQLIFLLLLLAMPVAAYYFVFEPRNRQITEAWDEITKKRVKLKQLEYATRDITDLGLEIDRLTVAIARFEQKLPAEQEVDVILRQVWELAMRHDLQPNRFEPVEPVATADYSELPISMVIEGDFDGFYGFLLELEKLPRYTRMRKMKLKKIKQDSLGQMTAEVVLSIFFEKSAGFQTADARSGRG